MLELTSGGGAASEIGGKTGANNGGSLDSNLNATGATDAGSLNGGPSINSHDEVCKLTLQVPSFSIVLMNGIFRHGNGNGHTIYESDVSFSVCTIHPTSLFVKHECVIVISRLHEPARA